jgi:hypothetical protein
MNRRRPQFPLGTLVLLVGVAGLVLYADVAWQRLQTTPPTGGPAALRIATLVHSGDWDIA